MVKKDTHTHPTEWNQEHRNKQTYIDSKSIIKKPSAYIEIINGIGKTGQSHAKL